ncbi:glutamate receptor ionotropic, NMDA 3A-like [Mya arenaria]|uniref:glutamate receptor ionotropic, NMDA 3A-like n=1 Tax=Mya arenaria TaxID=6604 RepID=UPI0022E95681|nr:glutamate receptor ionotropic, NMDA 3A-like [Mya arenaria]
MLKEYTLEMTRVLENVYLLVFLIFAPNRALFWSIGLMCDVNVFEYCQMAVTSSLSIDEQMDVTLVNATDNFISNLKLLNEKEDTHNITTWMGFGRDHVTNAVSCVARGRNRPGLIYTTSHRRETIYSEDVLLLHPDREGLASAVVSLIGMRVVGHAFLMYEDIYSGDGFLEVFSRDQSYSMENRSHLAAVRRGQTDAELRLQLLTIHDAGFRILVVHTSHAMFHRIATVASSLRYFDTGFAWLLTELALFPTAMSTVKREAGGSTPTGLLAVDGFEEDMYEEIIVLAVKSVRNATMLLVEDAQSFGLNTSYLASNLQSVLSSRADVSSALKRNILSNTKLFDENGRRKTMRYRLLNYMGAVGTHDFRAIHNFSTGSFWETVGFITDGNLDLDTVVWPGQTIFGPSDQAREFFTVVTRPAEPFIYIRGPVHSRASCTTDTACIEVFTHDPLEINGAVQMFKRDISPVNNNYRIFCCEGMVVDILHSLSVEVKFDFLMYFNNNSMFGRNVNGSWNGIIGDVANGAADIIAGAITMTSERLQAVDFTESFYFSSYKIVTGAEEKVTSLFAFISPFHPTVWITIIASAITVAIATSLFEWNSPFGLNPWGKKRKKNYTLGSALTMVFSVWFGHTVLTKSPKSWPSKWLQNFWAGTALTLLAGYTANLAAFLAGSAYGDPSFSILDSKLLNQRVGAVRTSAVEEYVKVVNAALGTKLRKHYVNDLPEAFRKLRSGELDMYMDDTPLLEHALSIMDDNCSIHIASRHFGENSYAFGVKKGSWIKHRLDGLLLNYVELGYIEDLMWRYMGHNRQCNGKPPVDLHFNDRKFGFPHTKGLFVTLLATIGLALVLLALEHLVYFVLVPRLRGQPPSSIWMSRNVEYFSQRLYKALNSEKVEPPARVIMSKVRQRKLLLQSELQYRLGKRAESTAILSRLKTRGHFIDLGVRLRNLYKSQSNLNSDNIFTIPDHCGYEGSAIDQHLHHVCFRYAHAPAEIDHQKLSYRENAQDFVFDNPVFELDATDGDFDFNMSNENSASSYSQPSNSRVRFENLSLRSGVKVKTVTSNKTASISESPVTFSPRVRRYETWPSPQTRRRSQKRCPDNNMRFFSSDVGQNSLSSKHMIVNEIETTRCRSCSTQSTDSPYKRHPCSRLEMKDNRVKSNLRHHAMASFERRASYQLDASAVEALSKEDLLVLWKTSEIELQTKLNRLLQRNNHLRNLVDLVQAQQHAPRAVQSECADDTSSADDIQPFIITTRL